MTISQLLLAVAFTSSLTGQPSARAQSPEPSGESPHAASPRESDLKAFATLDSPIKAQMEFALDYADVALKTSPSVRFEVLVGGKATVLVLDSTTPVRQRLQAAITNPILKVYACSEDMERLRQRLTADRVRLVSGVLETNCTEKVRNYLRDDWLRIDVTEAP